MKTKVLEIIEEKKIKDVEDVNRLIRNIQSKKSRLRKKQFEENYNEMMTEILQEEQTLKEVKEYLDPKDKPVHEYTNEDIKKLTMIETNRALKNIQSRKCLNQLDEKIYTECEEIEKKLNDHKEYLRMKEVESVVTKNEIRILLEHIEATPAKNLTKTYIINQIENLLEK